MTVEHNLEDIIRKVQALMARADHPNTPVPEAEACRAKAEVLMMRYRIEATMLGTQATQASGTEPVWHSFRVCRMGSEFRMEYRSIVSYVLMHFQCRGMSTVEQVPELDENLQPTGRNEHFWVIHYVGYPADVRFAEVMATAFMLAFTGKLEPKYDPELSEATNAYIMRSAGMEGRRIAQAIYGRDDKPLRAKVRRMFKEVAITRGEDPTPLLGKGVNVKGYRRSYAEGFATEVYYRLARMREAAKGEGLVLASYKDRVDEAFYERFPDQRPQPTPHKSIGDGYASCAKCAKAKRGYCREHAWRRPRREKDTTNYTALRRGAEAARSVNLGEKRGEIQ